MYQLSKHNQVSFKHGAKPYEIKAAQQSARDIYLDLVKGGYPQAVDLAYNTYLARHKDAIAEVMKYKPWYRAIVYGAASAYGAMGGGLAVKRYHHMNVTLTEEDLIKMELAELAKELKEKTKTTEWIFLARELESYSVVNQKY